MLCLETALSEHSEYFQVSLQNVSRLYKTKNCLPLVYRYEAQDIILKHQVLLVTVIT